MFLILRRFAFPNEQNEAVRVTFEQAVELRSDRLDELRREVDTAIAAYQVAVGANERAGNTAPSSNVVACANDVLARQAAFHDAVAELQTFLGLPDDVLDEVASARRAPRDQRYRRADVEKAPTTGFLDDVLPGSLSKLLSLVDDNWLRSEAEKGHLLPEAFLTEPLHVTGNIRFDDRPHAQRFARMLLVTQDHLRKHDRLDFFEAPLLVVELASLGAALPEIDELGAEAREKLRRLPAMTDDEVAATIYELLVGAAARKHGLNVEMLPASKSVKTPDFRIHGLGVPAVIECKRRLGLSQYEFEESAHVRALYESIRVQLRRTHVRLDAVFSAELRGVSIDEFRAAAFEAIGGAFTSTEVSRFWGTLVADVLPYTMTTERTRLYAPNYMEHVFGWVPNEGWDGISCEVDDASGHVVTRVKNPRALRWVSTNRDALTKKARGVTSLWGKAMQQVPPGDMAFIYIAYPEFGRREAADARTQEIMDACGRWTYRWSRSIGTTVINRLYPRSLGAGAPDLIESAIPLAPEGDRTIEDIVPSCVFTPPPLRDEELELATWERAAAILQHSIREHSER
ncbi:MAG TPA: hypothetical protein VHU41_04370 [Thermoanaerobaculia bacterium]|nr:hypothetical protein [Thermoanaerobaculia bacterium]